MGRRITKNADLCPLLAWHLYDEHIVMDTLFYRDEELCKKIMSKVIHWECDDNVPMFDDPFVFTMEEAMYDADHIRKEKQSAQRRRVS